MKPALTYKSITLAGYETQVHAVTGTLFVCKSATADFSLTFDGGAPTSMSQGWSVELPQPGFTALTFTNPTAGAITIAFWAGNEVMAFASQQTIFTVLQPATYTKGSGQKNDAAATYNGTDNGKSRKQFIIANLDGANPLYLMDNGGTLMALVPANTSWTTETSGVLKVSNPNGCNWIVGEIFYS